MMEKSPTCTLSNGISAICSRGTSAGINFRLMLPSESALLCAQQPQVSLPNLNPLWRNHPARRESPPSTCWTAFWILVPVQANALGTTRQSPSLRTEIPRFRTSHQARSSLLRFLGSQDHYSATASHLLLLLPRSLRSNFPELLRVIVAESPQQILAVNVVNLAPVQQDSGHALNRLLYRHAHPFPSVSALPKDCKQRVVVVVRLNRQTSIA